MKRRHFLAALATTPLLACQRPAPTAQPADPSAGASGAGGAPDPSASGATAAPGATRAAGDAAGSAGASTSSGGTPSAAGGASGASTPAAAATSADRPLTLSLGTKSWPTTLGALGLAGGRPSGAGGTSAPPELEAFLARLAPEVEQPVRNARLRIRDDGTLDLTTAQRGLALDASASRERVLAAAAESRPTVELLARPVEPTLTDAQIADAHATLKATLGRDDGPILTVKGGDRSWTLDRVEAADLLALDLPKAAGDPLKVTLDEWATKALIGRLAKALDQEATFDALRKALLAANRTLELPLKDVAPSVGDDPAALGPLQPIESGSTALGGAIPEKRTNIKLAAERLNGTVVPPGGTFSFNREVGPTTLESGFKWGFGITSGEGGIKTVPSVAGGICQVATTLFQPVFWAGYPLEERYWHLYWIPSYASRGVVGLDVTVDEDAKLDFKWINASKTPVLIQAAADDEKVTFSLFGKKPDWTVKVDPAKVSNRVPPDTTPMTEEEPTMPWGRTIVVEAAREGFDVEVVRRVTPADGAEPRVLTLKSSYQPSHTVTLVGTAGKPPGATIPAQAPPGAAQNRPAAPAATPAADASTPSPAPAGPGTPTSGTPAAPPTRAPAAPSTAPAAAPTSTAVAPPRPPSPASGIPPTVTPAPRR